MFLVELVDHALARAGTLTLLHFLWQGMLIAVGLSAAVELLGIHRASTRYACSLAALLLMAAMPPATLMWLIRSPSGAANPQVVGELPAIRSGLSVSAWQPGNWILGTQPYILAVWTMGVACFSCRLLLGVMGVRHLRRARVPLPPKLAIRLEGLLSQLGMSSRSVVFLSYRVGDAIAIGLVRPIVLIPAAWATEMPPELLEAIIAHELAHLCRWDVWVNILQRIIEAMLFYHPAVWWLSRRMRIEREFCCDELAVSLTGRRLEYAQALEIVARGEARVEPLFAASIRGEKRMQVLARVRNVLGMSLVNDRSRVWPAGLLALLLPFGVLVGTAGLASADSTAVAASNDDKDDGGDDKPAFKRREREGDDDDDKPAVKRTRKDDDDRPAVKRTRKVEDDDDDRPSAKKGRSERDDDDADVKERKVKNPPSKDVGRFGVKKDIEIKDELKPGKLSTNTKEDPRPGKDKSNVQPWKSEKDSPKFVREKVDDKETGDQRIDELKMMVAKLMAENKRLRAELDELRSDEIHVRPKRIEPKSSKDESDYEESFRKALGNKRAAIEDKKNLIEKIGEADILEKKFKQLAIEKEEQALRQRKLAESAAQDAATQQRKLKEANAELDKRVHLERQLKELAEQVGKITLDRKRIESLEVKVKEELKRQLDENKRREGRSDEDRKEPAK